MTWKNASVLILGTLILSSCYEDEPIEAPVAVELAVEDFVQIQVPLASLEAGDPFVLLATTLSGKLIEIDVVGESVRLIGETEPFINAGGAIVEPGWTGITVVDGKVLTSSWDLDDSSLDGCDPFFGSGEACTHIYEVDGGTGLVDFDLGSMDVRDVYDIDANGSTIYGTFTMAVGQVGTNFLPVANQAGISAPLAANATSIPVAPAGTATVAEIGWLAWTTATGVATIAPGPFTPPGSTVGGGLNTYFVEGGLAVAPDGTIWVAESDFFWPPLGPRLFTVDPTSGAALTTVDITIGGARLDFGFSALEITPDGVFFASRERLDENDSVFELYRIDPVTGFATLMPLGTLPVGVINETISGLEAVDPPVVAQGFAVTGATAVFSPTGVPGEDSFTIDIDFVLGTGASVNLLTESFNLIVGPYVFSLPGGSFTAAGGGFVHTETGTGLTLVQAFQGDDMIHITGSEVTINALALGAPVTVSLQIGDDLGTDSPVVFTGPAGAPGGAPGQEGDELYASTNQGELVLIDLRTRTSTLIGTAETATPPGGQHIGWTGLAFKGDGRLFTSARWRNGDAVADDCAGGIFPNPEDRKCSHLYEIDPATGAIIQEIGSTYSAFGTGSKFLSDLEFGPLEILFGIEFLNARDIRDGGLLKIDENTGEIVQQFAIGQISGFDVANGGLAMHPVTQQGYLVENDDQTFSRLLQVSQEGVAIELESIALKISGSLIEFGFDGLEITADGRFYATRAHGSTEIYRINPLNGEVRLQDLEIPPGLVGSFTGLDTFRETTPPQPPSSDLIDTFIRKDECTQSDKSNKSDKSKQSKKSKKSKKSKESKRSNKSGKSQKSCKSSRGQGSDGVDNVNEGGNPRLEIDHLNRVLVDFELGDIDLSKVQTATLVLSIDPAVPVEGWGNNGRKLDIHELEVEFEEGNGINTGLLLERFPGTGAGATWRCASDSDISNLVTDCADNEKWNGGTFRGQRSDRVTITNGQSGTVEFDLTADVQDGVTRWLLKTSGKNGVVSFISREGAAALGDFTVKPRLLVTLSN